MKIRPATSDDAPGMSVVLSEIIAAWQSDRASDPDHIRTFYIEHPDRIQCSVAKSEKGEVIGFQSLKLATEDNPYGVTLGWGIIGTYVRLNVGRRGIGSALFAATKQTARQAGIPRIDATIGENNTSGLAYYEAMGFRTYRTKRGAVCKCYNLADTSTRSY